MNIRLLYFFAGCFAAVTGSTQPSVITLSAPVPLLVQCDTHVDTLVDNYAIQIVSQKIKIALIPRGTSVEADHYLIAGIPADRTKLGKLVYRIYINHPNTSAWIALPEQQQTTPAFASNIVLADTSLNTGDSLFFECKSMTGTKLLQRSVFIRETMVPEVVKYRETNSTDTIGNSIKAKNLHQTPNAQTGYRTADANSFILEAGKDLELLLKNRSLNRDSSILFRLRSVTGEIISDWKKSGHLFRISNLSPGESFSLDLRYENMEEASHYYIITSPSWLQQPKNIWLLIILFITVISILFILVYRWRIQKEKESRKRTEEKLKTVKSQLNPHFVFNAVGSISALVSNHENDRANEYLAMFSDMMRDTVINSDHLLVSLANELQTLSTYLRLEQLRFGFRYEIYTDPQLPVEDIDFPPLLLQPSVENAVKHGVAGMEEKGLISIRIIKQNNDLVITIEDNGQRNNVPLQNKGLGRGISLTKERIEHLQKLYKSNKINYSLQHFPAGSIVQFDFKNWIL